MLSVQAATTPQDKHAWNGLVLTAPATSFFVTANWFDSYQAFGMQAQYLLVRETGGAVVGGAALAIFKTGVLSWVQVPHSPIILPGYEAALPRLLDAIEETAVKLGAIFIQISPFIPAEPQWEQRAAAHELPYDPGLPVPDTTIRAGLQARGYRAQTCSRLLAAPVEGQIVPLYGDLLEHFRKGTRRDIRATLALPGARVEEAITRPQLEAAYQVLAANAQRQNYPIRPWETFRQAAEAGIEQQTLSVLLALYDDEIHGAAVITFGGGRGYYCMGGDTRPHIDRFFPAHLLQYHAMQMTLARGYTQYDLTALLAGGVAEFKRGFRPTYYRLAGDFSKICRPHLYALYTHAYPYLQKYRRPLARLIQAVRR